MNRQAAVCSGAFMFPAAKEDRAVVAFEFQTVYRGEDHAAQSNRSTGGN
ncbi:MAG TPA: hypothetical protein VL156_00845 [Terriglobales bacterium]|jgi:hypothetical protein|nr:hypothetical protein [Terriglobales bacterium]